ncbi:MAG: phospholipid carrier-dependent glycosyltransferase [Actinomycetota bacterium]|nr:phospholipid carrier-dependent glycosyltransferase [Actinomycetota bacterium]
MTDRESDLSTSKTRGWSVWDTAILLGLSLVGGFIRLLRVGDPHRFVFDEVYYAKEACYYAKSSLEVCKLDPSNNEVHPPLGKWLISRGIEAFDFTSTGYRIVPVVAGTITIALLFLFARKILASTLGAAVAAGALTIDPLHFVQSRTSMLDVFVPLFGVAAFLFVAMDRDRLLRFLQDGRFKAARFGISGRPWRLAAGAVAGAAFASKWTGAFVIPAILALTLTWELSARRHTYGWVGATKRIFLEEGLSILLLLVVLPVAVYTFTYVGRESVHGEVIAAPWSEESWFNSFWHEQYQMWDTHSNNLDESSHSYQSPAWTWPLLKRPVSYAFCAGADCNPPEPSDHYKEILATGSPFVWWSALLALVHVMLNWLRKTSLGRPEGVILAGFVFSYVPWLLPSGRSAIFIFYFVATLPFMFLALGYTASVLGRSWEASAAIAIFAVVAIGFFIFYYPILSNRPIYQKDWEQRLLFFDDAEQCAKPPGRDVTTTVTTTVDGSSTTTASISDTSQDKPPVGWCWI